MDKLLLVVRSSLFAPVFYLSTAFFVLLCMVTSLIGKWPLRMAVRGWGWSHRLACRWILGQKIRIEGELPSDPVLYVFKHESMFETIDVLVLFKFPVVAAKQELLDIPFWGWVAERYGLIGIQRKAGAKALRFLRTKAQECVAEGRPLILFPEGTRVPHGVRAPLRSGFAGLYQMLGMPVVPVALDTGRFSPRGSFLKRPGTITYKVGEMIPVGLPRDEAEARAFEAINALNPPAAEGPTGDGLSPAA